MCAIEYSKSDLTARYLKREELENPYRVIYSLFDASHLPQLRESLREWIRVTVTGDFSHSLSRRERMHLMEFTHHIERLVEAAHIIHEKKHGSMLRMKVEEKSIDDSEIINQELFEKPQLKFITKKILSITRAEKIYLISGNGVREEENEKPFYDLLILVPDSNQIAYLELELNIRSQIKQRADVSLLIMNARRVYQMLSEGHLFYSLACRKNKLLFDDGFVPMPLYDFLPVDLLIEKAKHCFEKQMKNAADFLRAARLCIEHNNFALAAFMLHQATELSLRAILISVSGLEMQTHNLDTLLEHSMRVLPDLKQVVCIVDQPRKEFSLIKQSYIKSRYMQDFDPSKEMIEQGMMLVQTLHQTLAVGFEKRIEEFKTLAP